jgi:hypothetical protein
MLWMTGQHQFQILDATIWYVWIFVYCSWRKAVTYFVRISLCGIWTRGGGCDLDWVRGNTTAPVAADTNVDTSSLYDIRVMMECTYGAFMYGHSCYYDHSLSCLCNREHIIYWVANYLKTACCLCLARWTECRGILSNYVKIIMFYYLLIAKLTTWGTVKINSLCRYIKNWTTLSFRILLFSL